MPRIHSFVLAAFALSASALSAQKFDFSIMGGGGFGQKKTVSNPLASPEAGFKNGIALSAAFGSDMYNKLGGELRYTYQMHDLTVQGEGDDASFDGESHAVHYDLLLYATSRGSRVRPYVAGGGGIKVYRGTGEEDPFQPLGYVVALTKTSQTVGLVSFGGGVKFAATDKLSFRVDVRDYLTPFPKEVIAISPSSNVSGWLNNIVAVAGVAFVF